ncbi:MULTISPECIES: DUF5302 domain-containing protein [Streptomyces]|uniref:DUF5302 domain-containing protein n=1 Tax=Streptomyces TaxID=1883 RepID=UPI001F263FF3|nr:MULTISPECIES: DUF5302 domain-containing protein [unclassified Streptomyces]WTI25639.1 DUF5302 domain-containing protein [Streptomyces jietaisiensis]MCF0085193.1 hypothetical protein [Streptomyces sp. MH192]MCF0097760.1 hypothetical protein [Streptomyces sp. MH191]MDX3088261.1 DUF5302 domain-containing protein [Streptomyces sp. ME12-02E]MDX3331592.1 DUF5302 domain-containing protein [Streptomyces sp. ME02-6978a]
MTAENVSPEGSEQAAAPEAAPAEAAPLAPDSDGNYDLKRKFREALERKRGTQANAAETGGNPDAAKVRAAHGPAASQRSFRRKSGG